MKNLKNVLSIILPIILLFNIIVNEAKAQTKTEPPTKDSVSQQQDLSLLQTIALYELKRYKDFPFSRKCTLSFDSVRYFIDSTFIAGHNLLSSGYLYWPNQDTIRFSLGFQLHQNQNVFSLEYYQMDLCFKKKENLKTPDLKINYSGEIEGCINGNHACLSPTDYYRQAVPFKVLQMIKK